MSLALLLRPTLTGVIPPPPPEEAPVLVGAAKRPAPPPQLVRFPAGRARIFLNALVPDLILIPELGRATVSLRSKAPVVETAIEAPSRRHHLTYRAVRDEIEDEEFARLVEAAYLLTR